MLKSVKSEIFNSFELQHTTANQPGNTQLGLVAAGEPGPQLIDLYLSEWFIR